MKTGYIATWEPLILASTAKSITESKISAFSSFEDGWCCGRGIKFSGKVIRDAIEINNLFISFGFYETDAFPGEDDEIMVAAYKNDSCCEIIVYKNRSYDFVTEVHGEEKESKESISFEDIAPLLTTFRKEIVCALSEFSTQSITMIKEGEDSPASHSRTRAIQEEYQLLTKIAYSGARDAYAITLTSSIVKSQVTQSFSGNFPQMTCQELTA